MAEFEACDKNFKTEIMFNSVTSEYSLYCNEGHWKEFMQALTVFASSIISSVILMFQNKLGSRTAMVFAYFFTGLTGFFCLVFVDNLAAKCVGMTGLWIYHDVTFTLTPVFFNELLVEPFRNISNAIARIAHSLGAIFGTLMTFYLTDYKHIVCLYFFGYTVYNLMLMFALPSSPSFLLKQNKSDRLVAAIERMADVNGLPAQQLQPALASLDSIVASNPSDPAL